MSGDPYFNNVSLLLHMDGSNGSTTFTDSSKNNLTVTASGSAKISTTQSKFGGSSAAFDGSGDYLTTADTSLLSLGSGDFAVECWVYLNNVSKQYQNLLDFRKISSTESVPAISVSYSDLRYEAAGSVRITGSAVMTAGVWHHVAVSRSGPNIKLFLNGNQIGSTYSDTTNYQSSKLTLGRFPFGVVSDLNGYLDDVRITNSVARYTENFTPPTEAFPNFMDMRGPSVSVSQRLSITQRIHYQGL